MLDIGSHEITYTATDGSLNAASCSFLVHITEAPTGSLGVVVGVVISIVILLIVVFVLGAFIRRRRKRSRNEPGNVLSLETLDNQEEGKLSTDRGMELPPIPPSTSELGGCSYVNLPSSIMEFPRKDLRTIKELGRGAFGQVLLAEANGILVTSELTLVAIKTLKDGADAIEKKNMIQELELMKKLPGHKNIVKLLGFCVQQDPLYIIVEYMSKGNLKDFLKESRNKKGIDYGNLSAGSSSLTARDLMNFANDVADGMTFISSHKCIHRDLAARNILIAEDKTCKVSDFGLARDVIDNKAYERQSEGRLPLRWMALESVVDDVYTTQSDVWSYGVLLWEIITLGARPYPDMSAKMMVKELRKGYRMPKPKGCHQELYRMMLSCWKKRPESRPTFEMISKELNRLILEEGDYVVITDYEEIFYDNATVSDDSGEKV